MSATHVELAAITLDALEPRRLAQFWGAVLDREGLDDPHSDAALAPDERSGTRIRFMRCTEPKRTQNLIHFDITSTSRADQEATVARVLDLGGQHVDVGQSGDEGHVVLGDPEGNEFCVIEPGNRFLAGCGRLGAINCEGTRALGRFWSYVLGWPLVWDQDEETAVQSPLGGVKVTWSGPPLTPRTGRGRVRFDLASHRPLDVGVDHLRAAGAHLTSRQPDEAHLTDPDGNEFRLLLA